MRRELLIATGPGEWRAALLADGVAVELYVERGDIKLAGSLHLGRVVRRAPGLDSVFVEIGDTRPGLLPFREAAADGVSLDEGARVIVQVRREAQHGKGARLSTRVRAPTPPHDIASHDTGSLKPPAQLHPPPGLAAALALHLPGPPDRISADDPGAITELRVAFPDADIAHTNPAEFPVDIDALIETGLARSVALAGGGTLHIEETRAGTVIDIDTGNPAESSGERGATAANREAVRAIARQLRLRNIGGGIVIDFAALEGSRRREAVRQILAAALASDPAKPEVLGWTRLGHLELVRPRRGRSLSEALLEPASEAAQRKTALTLAYEALRALAREARARPGGNWRLLVRPGLDHVLHEAAGAGLRALEASLGRPIDILVSKTADRDFDIVAL